MGKHIFFLYQLTTFIGCLMTLVNILYSYLLKGELDNNILSANNNVTLV